MVGRIIIKLVLSNMKFFFAFQTSISLYASLPSIYVLFYGPVLGLALVNRRLFYIFLVVDETELLSSLVANEPAILTEREFLSLGHYDGVLGCSGALGESHSRHHDGEVRSKSSTSGRIS